MDKELKDITEQINGEVKRINGLYSELQKEIAKKAGEERLVDLQTKAEAAEMKLKTLSDQFDAIELKLKDRTIGRGPVSVFSDMEKAWREKGKSMAKVPGGQFAFELKGNPKMLLKASTIDESTELSDSSLTTAVVVPMATPGVEALPDRAVRFSDIVGRGVTGSNRVSWVERSARTDGTAAVTNDYSQYVQSDFTWIRKFAEVEKIGTFIKITNEALEDWDECMTQIRQELFPMVEREFEEELYSGSGSAPHLDGIITSAQAYGASGLDGKVVSPNTFDAIRAAAYQCAYYNYEPNYAFLNPADFAEMEMTKNDNGTYVIPPFASANGLTVSGLRVVQSSLVTAGQVLVGDFRRITLYLKRNIEVKIWDQDSTDPEYDLKTITASCRAAVKFPAPHAYGFVYDAITDITDAITKLTS